MIDTHLHLFDPVHHAFADDAPYRPLPHECASWPELKSLLHRHGVKQAVLVAPTAGYNHNLTPLTDTLRDAGTMLRGVARLRGDESEARLDALAAQGVVGVRVDLRHDGADAVTALSDARQPQAWAQRDWFVQVQADTAIWAQVGEAVAAWPNDLVVDHCGWPDPRLGLQQPGHAAVLALANRGRTWLKLSGPFRFSRQPWPHADTDIYAQRLVAAFGPQRCIWGSDWPFVRLPQQLDYGDVLKLLSRWVPDADARNIILTASPRELLARGRP
ncbi:MAG: amidohydrolase family protein [Rubrivivax sp.]